MEFLELLWKTLLLRPYVFGFLLVYLISGTLYLGLKKTLFYLPLGYFIAWLSEFSSIHTGFPYGVYKYLHDTLTKELWFFGVPFMDSLSYVFLSYASYCVSIFLVGKTTSLLKRLLVGAFLMVFLDVLVDPVALRGDRWFLGKIHEYEEDGIYFGVPLSNFAGWFVVGFVLMGILQALDSGIVLNRGGRVGLFMGAGLYAGIIAFSLAIAILIGEWKIFLADITLVSGLAVLFKYYYKGSFVG